MSDFERELRRGMSDRAAAVAPVADLEDLVERIARDRSRQRRVSAFVLALVLVVGPIAGFTVARASNGSPAQSAQRVSRSKSTVVPKPRFAPSPLPELKTTPNTQKADALSVDRAVGSVGTRTQARLLGPSQPLSLGRMFARTAGDGLQLRVYGARVPSDSSGPPWWNASPTCFPNRIVQVDASNALIAATTQAYLYATPRNGLVATVQVVGTNEQSPVWVLVVQAAKGTTARATFPGGSSDSSALDGGVAVLGHAVVGGAGAATLPQQKVHVEILDSHGSVVSDASVAEGDNPTLDDPTPRPECIAPTTLPAPGAEQPADVAAATAGVSQAFTDAYSGTSTVAVREAAIDDPSGVDAVYAELERGSFAQQVNTAEPHVRDVVFLSATTAAVRYDIVIPNYSDFNGQLGEAVFTGGRWKITRRTFCAAVSLAIVTCPS
jgi:hypothetical protein